MLCGLRYPNVGLKPLTDLSTSIAQHVRHRSGRRLRMRRSALILFYKSSLHPAHVRLFLWKAECERCRETILSRSRLYRFWLLATFPASWKVPQNGFSRSRLYQKNRSSLVARYTFPASWTWLTIFWIAVLLLWFSMAICGAGILSALWATSQSWSLAPTCYSRWRRRRRRWGAWWGHTPGPGVWAKETSDYG